MECKENLYLVIQEDELDYLLPVYCTEKITQGDMEESLKVVDLSEKTGGGKKDGVKKGRYCIIINWKGERLALLADEISGFTEAGEDREYVLDMQGFGCRQRCFRSVVRLEEKQNLWGYVLDPNQLIKEDTPEDLSEDTLMETAEGPEGPERCGPAYSEALQACVTLTCGKHHLYISRQILKSAVLKPQIQPIPGALGRIAGLSEFDGRPLVYYDPAGTGNQRRLESYQFGIVLKDTCGSLYGIVGDLLGEDGGGEENLTPVREGIWEKCCDQADRI